MNRSDLNQPVIQEVNAGFSETFMAVMRHVYFWMCLGLFITASISFALVYTPLFYLLVQLLEIPFLFFGLLLAEIGVVWWLSARIHSLPIGASRLAFLAYAVLNGVTLSVIFLVYSGSSIFLAFIATASLFGAMGIIGYTTKMDLSRWGSYLLMGLLGMIIASVANYFFASSTLEWIITYAGIFIFLGLTVYDTQRIRVMLMAAMASGDETAPVRVGLMGALKLYLDFVNLFLMILRLLGGRRR